jgi:hypothetical protein
LETPRYVNVKSLVTLPDGKVCLTYIEDGQEIELTNRAVLRIESPLRLDTDTIRIELVAADQVIDL